MSWKATAVPYVFSPKTSERFFVYIPKLLYAPIITESFDIPCPNPIPISIDVWGSKFEIPYRNLCGFDFNVVVPEGSLSEIELMINKIFSSQTEVEENGDGNIDYFDILVIPLSGLLPEIFGIGASALQATSNEDGMSGMNAFAKTMTMIADILTSSGKPLPWAMKTIKCCYLKTAKISQWSATSATTIQKWTLTFHGHYVESGIGNSEQMQAIKESLNKVFNKEDETDGTNDRKQQRKDAREKKKEERFNKRREEKKEKEKKVKKLKRVKARNTIADSGTTLMGKKRGQSDSFLI